MPVDVHARTLRDTSVDNTNQEVKTSGTTVYYFVLFNTGTVDAYFHLYDALTADVTVGTTTPKVSFLIPAGASATQAGMYEFMGPPLHFEVGCIYAATTTLAGGTDPTTKPSLGVMEYR